MSDKFQSVMAKAQQLMLDPQFNALVESKAGRGRSGNSGDDLSALEAQAFGRVIESEKPVQIISDPMPNKNRMSKLPQSIRESFEQTPPLTGEDYSSMGRMTKNLSLTEQVQPQSYNQPVMTERTVNSSIDYSLIKSIIDESVRRQLNESSNTLRGLKIANGNKIQLLDQAGNLYEAVLTLKKKATK